MRHCACTEAADGMHRMVRRSHMCHISHDTLQQGLGRFTDHHGHGLPTVGGLDSVQVEGLEVIVIAGLSHEVVARKRLFLGILVRVGILPHGPADTSHVSHSIAVSIMQQLTARHCEPSQPSALFHPFVHERVRADPSD